MTASSGSDMPYGGTLGNVRLYAFCGTNQPFSPDRWFAALKQGNTFVTTGPMIEFDVDGVLPGSTIAIDGVRELTIRARAWGMAGSSAPRELRLIQFGQPIETRVSEEPSHHSIELQTTIQSEYGCWLAIHAIGHDGSEAHTTPVYVVRDGFRFWDPEQADAILDEQLAILHGTEVDLEKAEARAAADTSGLDRWSQVNAAQADAVRERIRNTRQTYHDLKELLPLERDRRR
jgi:hypothetical protein